MIWKTIGLELLRIIGWAGIMLGVFGFLTNIKVYMDRRNEGAEVRATLKIIKVNILKYLLLCLFFLIASFLIESLK